LQLRAVDLPAQHRHLVPQHQQLDVLGATITGELDQHLHDLLEKLVHRGSRHDRDRRPCHAAGLTQTRTSGT
jgi:hypothetical protein